jgi:RNA polymerase sigma-70 factor (ECF subfamily)
MELSLLEIEKLVISSQKGDDASFSILFDYFYPRISRYVYFRVNNEEAEDLISDIFLKIVSSLKKYHKNDKAKFSSWVFRIAHNTIIDFYRKKKEILRLTDPETDESMFDVLDTSLNPHDASVQNEEHQKIREILKKLPDIHREILELKFLEGFSNAEISQIIGKSEGNIRVIQLRALRELRKYFPEME